METANCSKVWDQHNLFLYIINLFDQKYRKHVYCWNITTIYL